MRGAKSLVPTVVMLSPATYSAVKKSVGVAPLLAVIQEAGNYGTSGTVLVSNTVTLHANNSGLILVENFGVPAPGETMPL